jgi:hypothetical protein
MADEILFLQRQWGAIPIAIEPRLADADNTGVLRQIEYRIPISWRDLPKAVGLDADHGADQGIMFGQFDRGATGAGINPDRQDSLNTRDLSAAEDIGEVVRKALVVEVRMRVDQHWLQAFQLGKVFAFGFQQSFSNRAGRPGQRSAILLELVDSATVIVDQ